MRKLLPLVCLSILAASTTLLANNWPHWRGPTHDGVSKEIGLPVTWSATENVSWKLPLPAYSGSTPIIWGDMIFLNMATANGTGDLELWAVDRNKKDVAWKRPIAGGNHIERKQNMSSPSPVTDGKTVWIMTGVGMLKAFDYSGKELWSRDIQTDYGKFGLNWGYASSPLLHQNALYVQVLHGMKTDDTPYVMRIDATTGKTMWKVDRPTDAIVESPDSYTTPALLQYGGKTEIVVTGGDVVTGHDPATGKELWRADVLNPTNNRQLSHRRVAEHRRPVSSSRRAATIPWSRFARAAPATSRPRTSPGRSSAARTCPTPVSDGQYLYVVVDGGVVYCLDVKTGSVIYGPERLPPGTYSASPILADGKIYVTTEQEGLTTVFKSGPKFEVLASNSVGDGCSPYCLSTVAISQGQLFIRSSSHLWAIGETEEVGQAQRLKAESGQVREQAKEAKD